MADSSKSGAPRSGATGKPRRPWRENLEAFGVAILMAILLKPMIIEAYQIPTPSMQPTLMGSSDAGVFDRILVDKVCYEVFEPKRWDIAVFRYPIRRNQNYVKRIVGMPGDRLRIAGGNLYSVADSGDIDSIHRKPDRIQEGAWKQIYPARRELDGSPEILGEFFEGTTGSWKERGDDLQVSPSSRGHARLSFVDRKNGGISNQIYDGYPLATARAIRKHARLGQTEGVQDVRFSFDVAPTSDFTKLVVELKLVHAGEKEHTMLLEIENGKARLRALVGNQERVASEPVDCSISGGTATELSFAHIDDRLMASCNGDRVGELEVGDARFTLPLTARSVVLSVRTQGGGVATYSNLVIDRDLHYVTQGLGDALAELVPEGTEQVVENHVIRIPDTHYFMMGDNTLASADSRQWKVFTVGMTDDGQMVDPTTHPEARTLHGNRRPWPLNAKPDNDENPVILRSKSEQTPDEVALTNDNGEVFRLQTKLATNYSEQHMRFVDRDRTPFRQWAPTERHVFFVPREHILGRPVAAFWPLTRIGFIR